MKSNKKNLYILIPVMLIVWGGIAYQIISGMSPEESVENTPLVKAAEPIQEKELPRYELSLDYEDPFRVSRSMSSAMELDQATINQSRVIKKTAPVLKETLTQWPSFKYGGKVKSSNNKEVGLLTVAGRSFLVKKGQIVKEVKVLDYSEDNITLEYKNEQKVVSK